MPPSRTPRRSRVRKPWTPGQPLGFAGHETNWVKVAVDELTGPTAAANRVGVSGTSIFKWIHLGYVPLSGDCQRLSEASGVPFSKLAGPKKKTA